MGVERGPGNTLVTMLIVVIVIASPALATSLGAVGADGKWQPGEIIAVSGLATIVGSTIVYLLAPFFRERLRGVRMSDPVAWAEDVRKGLLLDTDATRAMFQKIAPDWMSDRERALALALATDAKLHGVTSESGQTADAVRALQSTADRLADVVERLEITVHELSQDTKDHGKRIERMSGIIDNEWGGTERRQGERRRSGA